MSVTWKISHPERLVTALGAETISLQDIERYLDNVVVSDALPYAKIFDMGTAAWGLSDTDMLVLGARIRAYPALAAFGPIAIVAASDVLNAHARNVRHAGRRQRPLRIFREPAAGNGWRTSPARTSVAHGASSSDAARASVFSWLAPVAHGHLGLRPSCRCVRRSMRRGRARDRQDLVIVRIGVMIGRALGGPSSAHTRGREVGGRQAVAAAGNHHLLGRRREDT